MLPHHLLPMIPKIAHTKVTDSHRWVVKEKHVSLPDTEENWKPWLTKHPNFDEAKASLDRAWRTAHLCYGIFEEHVTSIMRCSCVHYEEATAPAAASVPSSTPVAGIISAVIEEAVIEEAVIEETTVVPLPFAAEFSVGASEPEQTEPTAETCPPPLPSDQ